MQRNAWTHNSKTVESGFKPVFLSLVEGTYFLVAKLCFIYSAWRNQTQILQYLLNMNTFFL